MDCEFHLVIYAASQPGYDATNLLKTVMQKSLHSGLVTHQAGVLLRFLWHEATRSISTPPWMGCQLIAGLPPALNSPVPIYTPGWRQAL